MNPSSLDATQDEVIKGAGAIEAGLSGHGGRATLVLPVPLVLPLLCDFSRVKQCLHQR